MKLWIGVVVVVVFLVLILIIVGIVKTKKKRNIEEVEFPVEERVVVNPATGDRSIQKGRICDKQVQITAIDKPLMERIQEDCDNWTDKDAAERLRKLRELYNIEK